MVIFFSFYSESRHASHVSCVSVWPTAQGGQPESLTHSHSESLSLTSVTVKTQNHATDSVTDLQLQLGSYTESYSELPT